MKSDEPPCRRCRASIGRQFARGHGHAEKIADRVLVFAPVEAPHRDPALDVGKDLAGGHEGAGERIEKGGLGLIGRLRFLLGRISPEFTELRTFCQRSRWGCRRGRRKCRRAAPFPSVLGVVALCMFAKEGPVRFIERGLGRSAWVMAGRRRNGTREWGQGNDLERSILDVLRCLLSGILTDAKLLSLCRLSIPSRTGN